MSFTFPNACSLPHFGRRLAAMLSIVLLGAFAAVAQPSKDTRTQIEAGRLEIEQIEAALQRDSLDEKRLSELRARTDAVVGSLNTLLQQEQPKADEIRARIDKLGAAPDAAKGQTENADIARDRAEQQRIWKEFDDTLRLARALSLRSDQAKEAIADRRLQNFTREILKPGASIASPVLWIDVARGLPSDLRALRFLAAQWWEAILNNLDWYEILILAVLAGAVIFGVPRAWRWVQSGSLRKKAPEEDELQVSRLSRALVALRMVVLSSVVPIGLLYLLQVLLEGFGLVPGRVEPVLDRVFLGLALVLAIGGLALGVFAPGQPEMRLFRINSRTARELWLLARLVAILAAASAITQAFEKAIVASLPLNVASKGVFAVLVSFAIIRGMRRAFSDNAPTETADVAANSGGLLPVRLACWGAALAIFIAALLGFVSLADFLVGQVLWISGLSLAAALLLVLIEEFLGVGLSADGAFGRRVRLATGLTAGSLDQFGVLGAGLARLILFVVLGFLLLAPWGVDSSNLFGTVRAAFFGFQVGGVTVSLSTIAMALVIFVAGFFITRAIQNWLETRYLPHTSLDIGLRNSIRTVFGYVGTIIAAMAALSQLGLSLEKLTLVAGALSVGIGFGLQSIVNNFVSGLILLWERPIRVGDYIVVGDEQGRVKRINVRATEIETFDRASLIIPNSEFISGRVKNWMHSDRIARIIIPVNVAYNADPAEVEALLRDAALAHREVLSEPKSFVQFKNLGESGLDFELFCYVDVDARGTARSELLFDIFERLKNAGIEIPYPTRRLEISTVPGSDQTADAIAASLRAGHAAPAKGEQ